MTPKLDDILDTLPPEQRQGALTILDHISAPLTARQIERTLKAHGVRRSHAMAATAALKHLRIIAIAEGLDA